MKDIEIQIEVISRFVGQGQNKRIRDITNIQKKALISLHHS